VEEFTAVAGSTAEDSTAAGSEAATNTSKGSGRFHHFGGFFFPYAYDPYPGYTYAYPYPVYSSPAVVEQAPAGYEQPPIQREVVYPSGKYVLEGDGVTQAYRWVWIPAAPAVAPAIPPG
jgi:hypothetical protein